MFADNPHHSRRWTILAILAIAQLMVVLDATIVNIALPSAQRALHFANSERQWIVTAYALAFGSLLLLGGRISDLFGRKWTFRPADAGVAAATVSASQQIGGSLGTALLSTIATSAIASYITGAHTHPTRLLIAHAAAARRQDRVRLGRRVLRGRRGDRSGAVRARHKGTHRSRDRCAGDRPLITRSRCDVRPPTRSQGREAPILRHG